MWDLLKNFDAFNIIDVPRSKNQHDDRLVAVGAQYDIVNSVTTQSD